MFQLNLQGDIQALSDKYAELLSLKLRQKALVRTLQRAHALVKEQLEHATQLSHNVSPTLIDKAYSLKEPRLGDTSATATITGKGLSIRTFVVKGGTNGETVGVLVKRPATLRTGFLVRNDAGKDTGVFVRDTARGKVVTQKGSYAGRVITRGPNKGKKLEREAIAKVYTVSVPGAVKANIPAEFETLPLAAMFQEDMDAILRDMGA